MSKQLFSALVSIHQFHKYFEWWETIHVFAEYPNFRVSTNTLEGRMIRQSALARTESSSDTGRMQFRKDKCKAPPLRTNNQLPVCKTESKWVCSSPSEEDQGIINDCSYCCVRRQTCQAGYLAVHVQGTHWHLSGVLCFGESSWSTMPRSGCCTLGLKGVEIRGEQGQQPEVQKCHLCGQMKERRLRSPAMAEGKDEDFQTHRRFLQRENIIPCVQHRDKKEPIQTLVKRRTLMTQRHGSRLPGEDVKGLKPNRPDLS